MKRFENKWVRAAIPALLIHCSIGSVYCWSSFSGALSEKLGVSGGILGWAFSLAIFFLGMSAAFAGSFVEKNIHKASLIACICFSVGMAGTGMIISLSDKIGPTASVAGIFICYGCIMGIGLGVGYLTPVKTLMLWFSENKGLGTGISIMGFGLAKAFASPVMNALQESIGLSAMFFVLAAAYFVMMLLGHFLLKKPENWVEPQQSPRLPLRKLLKSRVFVGSWLMFYLNITCGLALIACEKPILQVVGMTGAAISAAQACTAAANALGRLGFSTVSDRLKDRNTVYKVVFVLSFAVCAVSYGTKAVSGGAAAVAVILLIVINACYGGGFSTMPALLSSRFGMKHISEIHGYILSAWAFAGLTGNQLSAALYSATGRYETVVAAIGALYLTAMVICCFCVKPEAVAVEL